MTTLRPNDCNGFMPDDKPRQPRWWVRYPRLAAIGLVLALWVPVWLLAWLTR